MQATLPMLDGAAEQAFLHWLGIQPQPEVRARHAKKLENLLLKRWVHQNRLTDREAALLANTQRRDLLPVCWSVLPRLFEEGVAYRTWEVQKVSGGVRQINSPAEPLKEIQRQISDNVLVRCNVHFSAHGFREGHSIATNANAHLGRAQELINIDLANAFPSVTRHRIEQNLSGPAAYQLQMFSHLVPESNWDALLNLLVCLICWKNQLPQGAPTSPPMLNIVRFNLDQTLAALLASWLTEAAGYVYTNYADDLSISTGGTFYEEQMAGMEDAIAAAEPEMAGSNGSAADGMDGEKDVWDSEKSKGVNRSIHLCGWKINWRKRGFYSRRRGRVPEITGLVLNDDGKLTVKPERLLRFRSILRELLDSPELTDMQHARINGIVALCEMVYGRAGLPSDVRKPYLDCKEKFGLQDRPGKRHSALDMYAGGIL